MTELKRLCISFSLTLILLSLAVEAALNTDQKWSVGNHFGYEGGFCFPGLCIGGSGGSRFNFGREHYGDGTEYRGGNGYRQTLYCKPLTCWGGSCDALHLQLDKGLYESLIRKNEVKHASSIEYNIPETLKHNDVNINYDFKKVNEAAMAPHGTV
ncbi:hypothetical protein V5N11_001685 [Cardamine amara subsp. amara]|uniref:MF21 n=1 Tax=Cardamine amara subsp. amara TaxID=228776 RepID=A0ABD1BMZ5_CARAN